MKRYVPALVGLAFLIVYTFTLAPGLLPADSGEYQVTGAVLGVAHPPGYALYTMVAWLISRVPGIPPATAINFLSALLAAGALALLCRAVQRLTGSALAGVGAAFALGLSTTFWAQATTANIRMPAAFATAWALERVAAYRLAVRAGPTTPSTSNSLSLSLSLSLSFLFISLGLGVSHHASLIFVMALLGLYALWLTPATWRAILRRPWPVLVGLLPFLAWLYFPLRAGAFGAPPGIATPKGFLEHVLARGFAGDIFFFANPAALPDRLRIFGNILTFEFVGPVLILMAAGAVAAVWRGRPLGLVLLSATAAQVFVSITYRAPQTVEYLLPAYVLMAILTGSGLAEVFRWLARLLAWVLARWRVPAWLPRGAAGALTVLVVAGQALVTFPSYLWLAHDSSTRDYATAVLGAAPPDALILSSWQWATPLWYLQQVEGQRPDVTVQYVFPSGASLAQNWVDQIMAALPSRPVVVTSFFAPEYQALSVRFVPLGPAWQVLTRPPSEPPPGLNGGQAFGNWDFLGYRIESVSAQGVVIKAAWRASVAPPGDVSLYVHLLDPAGQLHSQMDLRHPAGSVLAGEVLFDSYSLPLRPDASAGTYRLTAGVYRPSDGTDLAVATLTGVSLPAQPFGQLRVPAGAVPLGNVIWLAGYALQPAAGVHQGDSLQVDLRFLAARPITSDYTVSLSLIGPGYRWQVQSDGTPAGGAIPTLKWILGSRVTDTHRLTIPLDAAPGTARLSLTLYDAFTQRTLAILDPALAAQGQTVPLGTVEVVGRS